MNDIKILLDKFYRGETSRDEEKKLALFFTQESLPDEFSADKKVFLALNECTVEIPRETSRKIESLIDSFEESPAKKPVKRLQIKHWAIAAAASLLLILGIGHFYKNQQKEQPLLTDTYNSPDDAYRATMDALQLFSENFAKGAKPVEKANAHLAETQKIVNQSLK